MKRSKRKVLREHFDEECQKQFISPIPPHITAEEKAKWEEELKWQQQEVERRKREGFYLYPED